MRKLAYALAPIFLTACAFQVETLDALVDPTKEVPDARDDNDEPGVGNPALDPTPAAPLPEWDSSRPFVAALGNRFAGNIGSTHDLDAPADLAFVYDDGWYTQVEVYARGANGQRVMLSLAVSTVDGTPWLVPGLGFKFRPGQVRNADVWSLGCEGPESGSSQMGTIFADTPYDEEPCEVGVDTEQDPENPDALTVTLAATFDADCPETGDPGEPGGDVGEPGGDDGTDLPDGDGDGDGDLPPPGEGGGEGGAGGDTGTDPGTGGAGPLDVSASFTLVQG
ncbi:MAG: hypothetical protein HYS27_14955 [Deltaproteobacteria bacterium]|nr:hypothetical protein [Deltaproteobacteria bacterium]